MDNITFVKLSIPDKFLITYESELPHVEDTLDTLENFLLSGFKVSLVQREDSSSVGVTLTDKREGSPNFNCCFSQWSGSLAKSVQKTALVLIMAQGGKWSEVSKIIKVESDKIEAYLEKLLREKIRNESKGT